MAQTPAERRRAQRRTARQLKAGQNPLEGIVPERYTRQYNPPSSDQPSTGGVDYIGLPRPIGLGDQVRDMAEAQRFAQQTSPEDEIPLTYRPTNTTWPGNGWKHRRTVAAGYNRSTETLRIQFFTNGAQYDYYDVPPSVARAFRRTESPGKFINAVLNNYDYDRID